MTVMKPNGTESTSSSDGDYHGLDSGQVTRLIIQSLYDLGYSNAAKTLEADSQISIETPQVSQFRTAVHQGDWDGAEKILDGLDISSGTDRVQIKFLMRRQEYLERLETQDTAGALMVLRSKLTPLNCNKEELHSLTKLLMCSASDLKTVAKWDGSQGTSRSQLFLTLQTFMPPSVTLSPHRLATLLNQSRAHQIHNSNYWMDYQQPWSLYKDFTGDERHFPTVTKHLLQDHQDEVWYLEFSHNGKYLASSSADKTVIVWNVEDNFSVQSVLKGHTEGVICLAWSPDDSMLLTSGQDGKAIIWDPVSGIHLRILHEHKDVVGACSWLPNGREFITGSPDKQLLLWNVDGEIAYRFPSIRVMNLAVTPDGRRLIVLCNDNAIHFFDLETREKITEIQMNQVLTSVTVSRDSKYALINVKPEEVHLWDLHNYRIVTKYVGQLQKEFVIRSCFGGIEEQFVLSGSQDNYVYVWNRHTAELIETIPGHQGTVNCVRWCPSNSRMFASAGDDGHIRIWGPQI